jgi:hypothetical protein
MRNVMFTLAACSLLALIGCAKLNDTRTQELKPAKDTMALVIPAFSTGVKVDVKVESDGGTLWACLFAADKEEVVGNELIQDKRPRDALGWAEKDANLNLSATFAPNQEGRLYVKNVGTKPATVKVTIVGR